MQRARLQALGEWAKQKLSAFLRVQSTRSESSECRGYCGDYLCRNAICKHIIAALLREGDDEVLFQVDALVRALKQRTDEESDALKNSNAA